MAWLPFVDVLVTEDWNFVESFTTIKPKSAEAADESINTNGFFYSFNA